MKIITYNVNGLRARVAPYRSLHAFLTALDADILCFQETKLSRQELTSDIAMAEGYEAFFSCTRTSNKGKIGYSGVATFCRVDRSMASTSGILPVAADEGFTGLLHCSKSGEVEGGTSRVGCYEEVLNMEWISREELFDVDCEGRCLVTDHGSFVLFNIYGPCVQPGDTKRMQFKLNFFQVLQWRWESLLREGRAVVVVGDLNIAPFPIDSCDPGPEFSANPCRKWLMSLLSTGGGPFFDIFRVFHCDRKDAYTFWSQASGAEEFNWGTRIDLILAAGPCMHSKGDDFATKASDSCHGFAKCEVKDSDIMIKFKRFKEDSIPRWAGGRNLKLEGSDHAPVFVLLKDQPSVKAHNTPSLAVCFLPQLRGRQQNIDVLLQKKCLAIDGGESESSLHTRMSPGVGISCTAKVHHGVREFTADLELKEEKIISCSNNVDDHSLNAEAADLCSCISQTNDLTSLLYEQDYNFSSSLSINEVSCGRFACHLKAESSKKFKKKKVQKASQTSLRSFLVPHSIKGFLPPDTNINQLSNCENTFKSSHETGTKSEFGSSEGKIARRIHSSSYPSSEAQHGDAEGMVYIQDGNAQESYTNNARNWALSPSTTDQIHADGDNKLGMNVKEMWSSSSEKLQPDKEVEKAQIEWKRIHDLMARRNPVCRGHGEPCAARTVKKAGPNIGRGFYVCARAQGPASNSESRCDHFEWASDILRK